MSQGGEYQVLITILTGGCHKVIGVVIIRLYYDILRGFYNILKEIYDMLVLKCVPESGLASLYDIRMGDVICQTRDVIRWQ